MSNTFFLSLLSFPEARIYIDIFSIFPPLTSSWRHENSFTSYEVLAFKNRRHHAWEGELTPSTNIISTSSPSPMPSCASALPEAITRAHIHVVGTLLYYYFFLYRYTCVPRSVRRVHRRSESCNRRRGPITGPEPTIHLKYDAIDRTMSSTGTRIV